jgi:hypothetical protein
LLWNHRRAKIQKKSPATTAEGRDIETQKPSDYEATTGVQLIPKDILLKEIESIVRGSQYDRHGTM